MDNLEHLLKCFNKFCDIFAVSATKIVKTFSLTSNINLQNYLLEFKPIQSNAGGALLYTANHLFYKPRPELHLNKANQLESTFIEMTSYIYVYKYINILFI